MTNLVNTLPNDFFNGTTADAHIYFYETDQSSQKNKINFSQNLLCFLVDGCKEIFTPNNKLSINNTQLFLLQSGKSLMSEKAVENNKYSSILLFFSDRFVLNLIANKQLSVSTGNTYSSPLSFLKDDYMVHYQQSLLLLANTLQTNNKLVETKLAEILLYLFHKNTPPIHAFFQSILHQRSDVSFIDFINKQANNNLTLNELAFLCNMSVSTFKRKFAQIYHTSPKKYFIEQRMQKAINLLQQNNRPSEIYTELGYENLPAFSSEFKKHFGVSPKTYLLQNRTNSVSF